MVNFGSGEIQNYIQPLSSDDIKNAWKEIFTSSMDNNSKLSVSYDTRLRIGSTAIGKGMSINDIIALFPEIPPKIKTLLGKDIDGNIRPSDSKCAIGPDQGN